MHLINLEAVFVAIRVLEEGLNVGTQQINL